MNIFNIEKLPEKEELLEILAKSENTTIERIVSAGHTTGWMSDERREFVLLIMGNATIEFENRRADLKAGDTLLIEKNERHRVAYTSREPHCIWLCIYF